MRVEEQQVRRESHAFTFFVVLFAGRDSRLERAAFYLDAAEKRRCEESIKDSQPR